MLSYKTPGMNRNLFKTYLLIIANGAYAKMDNIAAGTTSAVNTCIPCGIFGLELFLSCCFCLLVVDFFATAITISHRL